jgi:hypothetical protein
VEIVRDRGWLRGLSVRVRGKYVLTMLICLRNQHFTQPQCAFIQRQDQRPLLHAIHRHVDIVAGPRSVQSAGRFLAARTNQQPLDKEEQILAAAVVLGITNV